MAIPRVRWTDHYDAYEPVRQQAEQTLRYLREHSGSWVAISDLAREVYGEDTPRTRKKLSNAVSALRRTPERPIIDSHRVQGGAYRLRGNVNEPPPPTPKPGGNPFMRRDASTPENTTRHYCRACPEVFETTDHESAHRAALIHHIFEHDRERRYQRCNRNCELRAQPEEIQAGCRLYGVTAVTRDAHHRPYHELFPPEDFDAKA